MNPVPVPLPPLQEPAKQLKLSTMLNTSVVLVALATIVAWYTGDDVIEEQTLATVPGLVLYESPRLEHIKTKHSNYYYYVFNFYEQKHSFRLDGEYFTYSKYNHSSNSIDSLKAGDTIAIQMAPDQLQSFKDRYYDHTVKIVNFTRRDTPYIDINGRNQLINKEHKETMIHWCRIAAGILALIISSWLWIWYKRKPKG